MTATLTIDLSTQSSALDYPVIVTAASSDDGMVLSPAAETADADLGGALSRAAAEAEFKGKAGQTIVIHGAQGTAILVGTGNALTAGMDAENLGGHIFAALGKAGLSKASVMLTGLEASVVADIAHGAYLASYVFKHYFTKGDAAEVKMKSLTIVSDDDISSEMALRHELAQGVFLARDLVFEPANKLYPESYAERCESLAEQGLKITVLDEDAMRKEGMDLLLSVGQGSRRASRMVVMEWNGGGDEAPVALVGKGVCFDTGGISIKPAGGMEDMKWDMGGSAAVVGAMRALAGRKIKRNVVGLTRH